VIETFSPLYMQRALVEVLLLAVLGGVLGTWIVLRGLAFSVHAIGTATFPGLVVAGPWGLAPQLAALVAALGAGAGLDGLSRTRRIDTDAATGLVLVAALALGVILASDVYESGAEVDRLLFGTLIGLSPRDLWLTAGAVALVLVLDAALRRTWLATGFDAGSARALGLRTTLGDRALVAGIVVAVVVALAAVGALLVTVVLVVPAATVALLVETGVRRAQVATVALAAVEGVVGLWGADTLNVGPGATLAVLSGAVFALAACVAWARARGGARPGWTP
jgi:ABC-type Mn2+/Zn2+ transport system permease subunit